MEKVDILEGIVGMINARCCHIHSTDFVLP